MNICIRIGVIAFKKVNMCIDPLEQTLEIRKRLFAGGPPANKKLFAGGPLANKKLFTGGPLAYKMLFAQALSILCSPEWSYAVLSSFLLYCMVLYGHVRSFNPIPGVWGENIGETRVGRQVSKNWSLTLIFLRGGVLRRWEGGTFKLPFKFSLILFSK